ncbi:efflux RND transporter periplasmic adaptor subunit [Hydrocarboniphaga sp.]|uniref:efflux RND transporter periplasmic adaptor subunit n=1 Tax=Hydrocarboniphaga sp. TaxID=2033016 RepID=UPI003D0D2E1B
MSKTKLLPLLSVLILGASLAACGKSQPQAAPPPPEVGALTLAATAVKLTTDLPGRTVPYRVADVRPQVSGVVLKRLFNEGGEVKAGQSLYLIDPAPFQAALGSAQAALAKAEASEHVAAANVERYKPLVEVNAVSKQEYDDTVAAQETAQADVASARAQVQTAKINLAYTNVQSPISGRAGRSMVTEGALVTASQTTSLVTIQQLDPIYVDLVQPSVMLLKLRRQMASGELTRAGDDAAAAKLQLEDGSVYATPGKLQFSEVTVDTSTGSVTLRAIFPNADHTLLPGMFVHATLEEGQREGALLVPQQAVTHNQKGEPTAMVVGADDKVELRKLKTERAIGANWLVSEGLKAGDRVIVRGLQQAKPGSQVSVREVPLAELDPAAPQAEPPQKSAQR